MAYYSALRNSSTEDIMDSSTHDPHTIPDLPELDSSPPQSPPPHSPPPRFSTLEARFTENFNTDSHNSTLQSHRNSTGPSETTARSSTPVPLYSPLLIHTGLIPVRDPIDEKAEYITTEKIEPDANHTAFGSTPNEHYGPDEHKKAIRKKRRRWMIIITAAVLLVLVIALGAGLGAGLHHSDNSHATLAPSSSASSSSSSSSSPSSTPSATLPFVDSNYAVGGIINPAYYSKSGAFNGSGVALASQSFADDGSLGYQGNIAIYFQHWTGQIRSMRLTRSGTWIGGSLSEIVAYDAKNATPLSAVAYSINATTMWHVFYIDKNNLIRQRSNSNTSNLWVDGPVNRLNLKAMDADRVGMQACWYGSNYGDADWSHAAAPGSDIGMHLWYASDNITIQQYGWRPSISSGTNSDWEYQSKWTNLNGHAGVGCYSWGTGLTTYAMFVNLQNAVEIWWKDTNTTTKSTSKHPINQWTKTSVTINNVHPSSSLGYTNYLYAQDSSSRAIMGYEFSWLAENTSLKSSPFTVANQPAIGGTHLTLSAIPGSSGGSYLTVFFQVNGSDITEYTRDSVAGQWSSYALPIPAT